MKVAFIYLILLVADTILAICVEKQFIDVEKTVDVKVNENCLNFVQFETGFLTKISCENIEPYHQGCNGKVLTLRANTEDTIVYCLSNPSALRTMVDKIFLKLDTLELYLEGDDLGDRQVTCSISTKLARTSKTFSSRNMFSL